MANPQKENGYTAISNELMEALAKLKLPQYEWRCLLAILRHTYGWNRKTAEMSITLLQKITGLKRQHTSRSVNDLINKKIITSTISKGCTSTGTGNVRKLGIQKDYTQWLSVPLQVQAMSES